MAQVWASLWVNDTPMHTISFWTGLTGWDTQIAHHSWPATTEPTVADTVPTHTYPLMRPTMSRIPRPIATPPSAQRGHHIACHDHIPPPEPFSYDATVAITIFDYPQSVVVRQHFDRRVQPNIPLLLSSMEYCGLYVSWWYCWLEYDLMTGIQIDMMMTRIIACAGCTQLEWFGWDECHHQCRDCHVTS
jgi:hypothetical protein